MRVTCGPHPELDGVMLAAPVGHLDVHGATHFWEAIPPRVTGDAPSLLVDMQGVDWMTSAGIGVLIRVLNHVQPLGGNLVLYGCNEKVEKVIRICELVDVLNVCATAEDAAERIQSPASD
jgi:anti-anti-sigma factor